MSENINLCKHPMPWTTMEAHDTTLANAAAVTCRVDTKSCEGSEMWFDFAATSTLPAEHDCDCSSVFSALSCEVVSADESEKEETTPMPILSPKVGALQYATQKSSNEGAATIVSSTCSSPLDCWCGDDDDTFDSMMMLDDTVPLVDLPSTRSQSEASSLRLQSPLLVHHRIIANTSAASMMLSLPDDIICEALSYLTVSSLSATRSACRRLRDLASRDGAGWKNHCRALWSRKVHICPSALQHFPERTEGGQKNHHQAMEAYRLSCWDGRFRHEITENELCFDPETATGTVWHFRFKESAGTDWTSFDPWYAGMRARKMVFLRDGTIKQLVSAPAGRSHLPFQFQLRPAFSDATAAATQGQGRASRLELKWRFVSRPMDLPERPQGAYVRLTVGGREVPSYVVHRSPTGNWGFVMENCWGVYASFPLPMRRQSQATLPTAARPIRMRLRRTRGGGRWMNVTGIESDTEDEEDDSRWSLDSLLDDSALAVTNRWQWKEACLYNHGATSLPEGDTAAMEFDRVWNQSPWHRRPATNF